MAIKIEDRQISLSVRDLIQSAPQKQLVSSFPLPQRGLLGQRAQLKVQRQKQKNFGLFHSEYHIRREYPFNEYTFHIQGRIDGVYRLKQRVEIEEIKSVLLNTSEWKKVRPEQFPQFGEQLLFYAYMLQDELDGMEVTTHLILVNLVNDARKTFTLPFNRQVVEKTLLARFAFILNNIIRQQERQKERLSALKRISFDLPEERPQQKAMMAAAEQVFNEGGQLLVSAPTGTGKTAAALFPAIRNAYLSNKKIFFTTSKTSQQNIVHDTVRNLTEQGLDLHTIILRASAKMCANSVYFCHESFCPYAKDYHQRLEDTNLLDQLLQAQLVLTPEYIYERATAETLCPFEVSLDLSMHCDILVGDYNYVFDPAVFLRRLFQRRDYSDWLLIIDEAHNLYDRGLGYLSPTLRYEAILQQIEQTGRQKNRIFGKLQKALLGIADLFRALNEEGAIHHSGQQYFECDLNPRAWEEAFALYESHFIKYLIHKVRKKILLIDDPLEDIYYNLRRFVQVARYQDAAFVPFYNADLGGELKIQCCDPSHYLGQRLAGFHAVLAMSATLDPMRFYADVLGLEELNPQTLQLDSPFPARNRKLVIVPGISTRYKDRVQNYQRIAEVIEKTVALRRGNYLAFFPSFDFVQNVNLFLGRVRLNKILQKPGMAEGERDIILDQLRAADGDNLLLAVMGGVFSEGVDYSGRMAEGVFVISPALPMVSYERELLRRYYDNKQDLGLEYAYIYPGMNKVIQAVGRLIRAATDRGVVVLIGERFSETAYQDLLPAYWFADADSVEVTGDYLPAVQKFWNQFETGSGAQDL